jgi:hypothetical protein
MNPLLRLSPAVFTALSGLVHAGAAVPVYDYANKEAPAYYVLLAKPRVLSVTGRPTCRQWLCEVLIDVVTKFPTINVADAIADQVLERLDYVAPPLPDGFQCMEGRAVDMDDEGDDTTGQSQVVHRRLRVRWHLSWNGPLVYIIGPSTPIITTGRVRLVHA